MMQIFDRMMLFPRCNMRVFDYSRIDDSLRNNEVCHLISSIHESRGKQALFLSVKPDVLETLLDIAQIQSTAASITLQAFQQQTRRDSR